MDFPLSCLGEFRKLKCQDLINNRVKPHLRSHTYTYSTPAKLIIKLVNNESLVKIKRICCIVLLKIGENYNVGSL